jgi:hypothetical protein
MIKYPYTPIAFVTCTCCGAFVENTPEHNVSLHAPDGDPYPHDDGVGECVSCGGDPTIPFTEDEELFRKRMGWGACCFYDARIETMHKALNEANRAKFEALSYAKKCVLIRKAVEDGLMI